MVRQRLKEKINEIWGMGEKTIEQRRIVSLERNSAAVQTLVYLPNATSFLLSHSLTLFQDSVLACQLLLAGNEHTHEI